MKGTFVMAVHEVPQHAENSKASPMADPAIERFAMNGTLPFYDHTEAAGRRVREARAMLITLASAFENSGNEGVNNMNPIVLANALEGVATLLGLSAYHQHCVEEREFARA